MLRDWKNLLAHLRLRKLNWKAISWSENPSLTCIWFFQKKSPKHGWNDMKSVENNSILIFYYYIFNFRNVIEGKFKFLNAIMMFHSSTSTTSNFPFPLQLLKYAITECSKYPHLPHIQQILTRDLFEFSFQFQTQNERKNKVKNGSKWKASLDEEEM